MKYIEGVDGIFAASIERADPVPRPRAPVRVVGLNPGHAFPKRVGWGPSYKWRAASTTARPISNLRPVALQLTAW